MGRNNAPTQRGSGVKNAVGQSLRSGVAAKAVGRKQQQCAVVQVPGGMSASEERASVSRQTWWRDTIATDCVYTLCPLFFVLFLFFFAFVCFLLCYLIYWSEGIFRLVLVVFQLTRVGIPVPGMFESWPRQRMSSLGAIYPCLCADGLLLI